MTIVNRIPADTDLAEIFPYARAVRIGDNVEISGTGAYDESGDLVGGRSVYEQTRQIYSVINNALVATGTDRSNITKVTVFTTDLTRWEDIAKAHREYFGDLKPAVTVIEVTALMSEEMLVEIEASAVAFDQARKT